MKAFVQISTASVLLASAVSAQYAIDPNSVDNSTRQYWCQLEQTQCPLICLQTPANSAETQANDCDWQSLTYACVCSNGLSPNVSEYSQTLPYFICTEWGTQCVSNCNGDNACASACRADHPCGALDPTRQNTSTLTRTPTASASASQTGGTDADAAATTDAAGQTIYTGFAGTGPAQTSGGGGQDGSSSAASTAVRVWALSAGQTFGSVFVFGAMTLGFALML